jgi:hypothetical protein
MADILTFDPSTEFELIGDPIEFEEEVQRPEELRFFTLEEQLLDYQAKVLYGKAKVTRSDRNKIRQESERYKKIYDRIVIFAGEEDGYTVDLERKEVNVPWITPIYSAFQYGAYPYYENWTPIMDPAQVRIPNYYDRMLKAIPRPFKLAEDEGVPLEQTTTLVNEDGGSPIKALGLFEKNNTLYHDDGSFEVIKAPVGNTNDDMKIKGYYISSRGVDIPNPMSDHPFLSTTKPSKIITNERLIDIFPTVQTILNNAVPTSTDPYGEGQKYLKIYDVKLSQIPWASWKERFPPVDMITSTPESISVKFPDVDTETKLAQTIQKEYKGECPPAVNPRHWLMTQEDGGLLIKKFYLTRAGDAGRVPPEPLGEKPEEKFPPSTPDECLNTDSFDSFLNSGVYRAANWKDVSEAIDKSKDPPIGKCIPVDYIQRENSGLVSKGRIPWVDTTPEDLMKEYRALLRKFLVIPEVQEVVKYEKFVGKPDSEIRKDVLTILQDPNRTTEDKAEAIRTVLNMITPINNLYLDKDSSFILCEHRLSLMNGDLEDDRIQFYAKWATIDGGHRVCKFCGEQINNDVYIAQAEFDNDGRLIVSQDILESTGVSPGHSVSSITNSINELGKLIDKTNPGEVTLLILLSLLQVRPSEDYFLPLIQNVRDLTGVIRSNKKIDKSDREKSEGAFGIAAMVVLLQTHIPFLVPRRSFGLRTFKTSGFPRDTDDEKESPILDTLLYVIKSTFEKFPGSLSGPSATVIRAVIKKSSDVRSLVTRFLKQFSVRFKAQFEIAKDRFIEPPETVVNGNMYLPLIRLKKTEYAIAERIGDEELMARCIVPRPISVMTPKLFPSVSQVPIELWKNIMPSSSATAVVPQPISIEKVTFTDKDIRKRLAIGMPKSLLKSDKIEKFLKRENIDAISIFTLTSRILDILAFNKFDIKIVSEYRKAITYAETRVNPSLIRDTAKGILYEILQAVTKNDNKASLAKALDEASQKDIVMNMLLLTKEEAEKITTSVQTKERETLKQRMRELSDRERELYKQLIDIGLAPTIITSRDREIFASAYNYPDPEEEYSRLMAQVDENRPEEGYGDTRDYREDGMRPLDENGNELEVDYGDYGDRAVDDYNDYANTAGDADFDSGYGT